MSISKRVFHIYTQHTGQISVLPFWWQRRSMVWTGGPPTERRHTRKGCKKSGLWHYYITTLNDLSFISAHLKSVSVILYEVIVHSTDHPFVLIQDLCLQIEGRWNIKIPLILSPRDFFWKKCKHETEETHWMHIDQPARFLPRLLHPVEAEASVHLVGELAALQPLESGHRWAIVPDSNRRTQ